MDFKKLNTYRKGLKVERLHTLPHIIPYNNGFHSANAALIAHELCLLNNIESGAVVLHMLLHDIAEGYTGDMPANVKIDYPSLARELNTVENEWEEVNVPDKPGLSNIESAIVRVADLTELGMYCLDELALGNKNMSPVLLNVIEYIQKSVVVKGTNDIIVHFLDKWVK